MRITCAAPPSRLYVSQTHMKQAAAYLAGFFAVILDGIKPRRNLMKQEGDLTGNSVCMISGGDWRICEHDWRQLCGKVKGDNAACRLRESQNCLGWKRPLRSSANH